MRKNAFRLVKSAISSTLQTGSLILKFRVRLEVGVLVVDREADVDVEELGKVAENNAVHSGRRLAQEVVLVVE